MTRYPVFWYCSSLLKASFRQSHVIGMIQHVQLLLNVPLYLSTLEFSSMFAIFEISAAIVSQIFGLQPKHAAGSETASTPLEDYSNDDGTASRSVTQPATRPLTLEVKSHPTRVCAHHSLMFSVATASTFRFGQCSTPQHHQSRLSQLAEVTSPRFRHGLGGCLLHIQRYGQ